MPHSDPYAGRQENSNTTNAFQDLVQALSTALGPSSGLDSDDVDIAEIQKLMAAYDSSPHEWDRYALPDRSRPYTRNLVDEGNGKSNLLIVVWSPGKESPIHDHANAHCVMKLLKGSLKETLYAWPDKNKVAEGEPTPLKRTRETVYSENEVTYVSDKIGLHKISNVSSDDFAVSLHLYTPPHAANFGFNLFDAKTGKASHIRSSIFFSRQGEKL